MATYLQLSQKVARDSGTVSGTAPSAVTSQTGWLLKIVNWVADAWQDIQNAHDNWLWMMGEFSKTTTSGTARYTAAGWNISPFADWIVDNPVTGEFTTSLYLTSTGVSDEGAIRLISFARWMSKYGRGTQTNGRPTEYAISPALEFCLGPIPDNTYTVKGRYRKGNSVLAANADTPEMPARFHDLVARRALELLSGHDESPIAFADSKVKKDSMFYALERDQIQKFNTDSGPLA